MQFKQDDGQVIEHPLEESTETSNVECCALVVCKNVRVLRNGGLVKIFEENNLNDL